MGNRTATPTCGEGYKKRVGYDTKRRSGTGGRYRRDGNMTELEQAKIAFSDATIALEIAQGKFNEAKQRLIQELNNDQRANRKPLPEQQTPDVRPDK